MRPLVIRADASGSLGTGHVMRMIALAQAYKRRGGRVIFASVQCPEQVIDRVCELGIEHQILDAGRLGDEYDSAMALKLCKELSADWMVLDGYHFDVAYQKRVSGEGVKVLVVDDYGHCSAWHCDAVLNQNFGAEHWKRGSVSSPAIQWMLGSSFVLIREEFSESLRRAKEKPFPAHRVLVTLGGADSDNVTLKILEALEIAALESLHVRVLVGAANAHHEKLLKFSHGSHHQVEILCNVRDMPSIYEWTDAVISAGGSTCWEWLAYGLRGAVVTIADNQNPVVAELKKWNLALVLGEAGRGDVKGWAEQLGRWLQGKNCGVGFNERREVIDGHGAERVAASLVDDGLWCRAATQGDAKLYFDWANDPQVRSSGFHTSKLIWENHCEWFGKMIHDPSTHLYLVSNALGDLVGQVRQTPDPSGYVQIGFSVDNEFRGKGMGGRMLKYVLDQDSKKQCKSKGYLARVKAANKASSKIFLNLGFIEAELDPDTESFVYLKTKEF